MECIVLAGGTPEPGHALWEHTRGQPKALLPIGDRPMIGWVLEALRRSESVTRILVVGLPPGAWAPAGVETLPAAGDLTANLFAGIAALRSDATAMYCWSDIPLLRPAMVDAFVRDTPHAKFDVNAALVSRTAMQSRYPDKHDLWLRLREGDFIAADLGLFSPPRASRVRADIEALSARRFGLRCSVRQARDPELGLDVDGPDDLLLCRRVLQQRSAS